MYLCPFRKPLAVTKILLNKKAPHIAPMGWIRSGALFVDVGFDKEKIHLHLGHSSKFPPKNKRGNHNKKKPYSYVSVVANLPSLLYLFIQDSIQFLLCFVCLLFQLSKQLWKKVQFEPVKILFFLWMWNSYHQDLKINWIQFRTRKKVGLGLCTLHLHDFKIRIINFSACFILTIAI